MSLPAKSAPAKKTVAKKKATVKKTCKWVTKKVKVKGHTRKRKVKVCRPVKAAAKKKAPTRATPTRKPAVAPASRPAARPAATAVAVGQAAPAPKVVAPPQPPAPSERPVPTFTQPTGTRHMQRLLWRAGFGPAPGQAAQLASQDLGSAVRSLTRPAGAARLIGPEPHDEAGQPLAPADAWGHDHLWWLDRMIRSDQPLIERMALIWHDWFATSNAGVGSQQLMLDQIQLFRDKGLGSFDDLFAAVTSNPAMLVWLDGNANNRFNPNENYAREMMELFSLGADRGAYTETDVREMARALTGFRNEWTAELGSHAFRYDAGYHDNTNKTIFGQTGAFAWTDAVRLCVTHPLHASFFCTKLWSYFVPVAPDDATLAALQGVYLSSGRQIRPVVEAILQHPAFYDGPEMVTGPVVFNAGLLRAVGRGVDTSAWSWLATSTGQHLFYPPNVAGWDDTRWLDTSTLHGRWLTAYAALQTTALNPWGTPAYDPAEDAATAVSRALAALGDPSLSPETQRVIADFAATAVDPSTPTWLKGAYRAMRQNALRMLIANSPDLQVS